MLCFSPLIVKPPLMAQFTQPPLELIDGDDHYEVKKVLDSCFFHNQLQYLVSSFHLSHPTAASPSVHPLPHSILKNHSNYKHREVIILSLVLQAQLAILL